MVFAYLQLGKWFLEARAKEWGHAVRDYQDKVEKFRNADRKELKEKMVAILEVDQQQRISLALRIVLATRCLSKAFPDWEEKRPASRFLRIDNSL